MLANFVGDKPKRLGVVYTVNSLEDIVQHFAAMLPRLEKQRQNAKTQREAMLIAREIYTLSMVVDTLSNTVLKPKESQS